MAISLDNTAHPPINVKRLLTYGATTAAVLIVGLGGYFYGSHRHEPGEPSPAMLCDQAPILEPHFGSLKHSSYFTTEDYLSKSAKLLSGAVQVPTQSYDDMNEDPNKEPRFEVFKKLHKYLFGEFPLAAEYAETINTYGLLYTIPGSDSSLEPVVLMSHQDVVPVNPETLSQWEHEPFGGYFDGEWLHGRGASDTKNSLVGILEAVEALLSQKWKPKRTVLLSFGFDEEISGARGAGHLAATILERYGHHGVAAIVDEGLGLDQDESGMMWATAGVAEKGRADYRIKLLTPGGHSSMPPDHTGIGIIAELITALESDPFSPPETPGKGTDVVMASFSCLGRHAPHLDKNLRELYSNLDNIQYKRVLLDKLSADIQTRILVQTTQAVDTIVGGVKVNALPEQVSVEVDHRVSVDSNIDEVTTRLVNHVIEIAKTNGLSVVDSDGQVLYGNADDTGKFVVETTSALEPAPISPYYNDEIWSALTGVTKHVVQSVLDLPEPIMAPQVFPANTDTAHYWDVSEHIYRYTLALRQDMVGYHTVNERLRMRSHISTVVWFYEFLLIMDDLE